MTRNIKQLLVTEILLHEVKRELSPDFRSNFNH